jgi:hypothetical protein
MLLGLLSVSIIYIIYNRLHEWAGPLTVFPFLFFILCFLLSISYFTILFFLFYFIFSFHFVLTYLKKLMIGKINLI